jgi:hypothetical protein
MFATTVLSLLNKIGHLQIFLPQYIPHERCPAPDNREIDINIILILDFWNKILMR